MQARRIARRMDFIHIGIRTAAALGVCVVGVSTSALAANIIFNVAEGDWNEATHWNPQQIPGAADYASLNSGTVQVTGHQSAIDFQLCYAASHTAFLDMISGSLSLRDHFKVGNIGSGSVLQTGGAVTSRWMWVGLGQGVGHGVYTQQLGSVRATERVTLSDDSSTGVYHLVNGTLETPELRMVDNTGRAEFHQYSGRVTADFLNMGFDGGPGEGFFIQHDGTNTFHDVTIGRNNNQYSLYALTNGNLTINGNVYVTHLNSSSMGILRQAGGSIIIPNAIFVGRSGEGSMEQSGGTFQAGIMTIGGNASGDAGAVGIVTQTAGIVTVPEIRMCDSVGSCTSRYHMTGGTLISGELRAGYRSGPHDSRVFLSGGNMSLTNLYMSYNGGITAFMQSGGTNLVHNDLLLPRNTEAGSWYEVSGGTLSVSNNLTVGKDAAGTGTVHVVGSGADIQVKNYNQNAWGTLKASLSRQGLSPIRVSGTATLGGTLDLGLDGDLIFEPGMVVTVMTYSARSGVFDTTNFQDGFSCRVNYEDAPVNAITLDQLKPLASGTVLVIR